MTSLDKNIIWFPYLVLDEETIVQLLVWTDLSMSLLRVFFVFHSITEREINLVLYDCIIILIDL